MRQGAHGREITGVEMLPVDCPAAVFAAMRSGRERRATHATSANERSSRSHSVVTLYVRGRNARSRAVSYGKLVLVDLAGSERLSKTEATGDRLKEAQHINK